MPKVKVYGGTTMLAMGGRRQVRAIIATSSQQNAAKAFGLTVGEVRKFWSITGNPVEVEVATSRYGVPLVAPLNGGRVAEDYICLTLAKQSPHAGKTEGGEKP